MFFKKKGQTVALNVQLHNFWKRIITFYNAASLNSIHLDSVQTDLSSALQNADHSISTLSDAGGSGKNTQGRLAKTLNLAQILPQHNVIQHGSTWANQILDWLTL